MTSRAGARTGARWQGAAAARPRGGGRAGAGARWRRSWQVRKSACTSGWLGAHAEMNRQRMPETAARSRRAAAAGRWDPCPKTCVCEEEGGEAMNFNLAVILRETADASPAKAVAVYAGGQMTYGELDALSDRLAAGLE